MAYNEMSKYDWEWKEKRDIAVRVYNSLRINNPEMAMEKAMEEAEAVVIWLFNTYRYKPSQSAQQMKAQKEGIDMDFTPGKDDGEPPVSQEKMDAYKASGTREHFTLQESKEIF